jgi:hypothetical protein
MKPPARSGGVHDLAERLNAECQCLSFDRTALRHRLLQLPDGEALATMMESERPHLFSGSAVFVSALNIQRMAAIIQAVEAVVALPSYRQQVLAYAPAAAQHRVATAGVFLGYDFHLDAAGSAWPQLIEINTNAGGGLLNALLARAQRACCDSVEPVLPGLLAGDDPEHLFMAMFEAEWQTMRPGIALTQRRLAIVDQAPAGQYLYPEFLLFRQLFERHGIETVICDPGELSFADGRLWQAGKVVDLVYNRLTDFSFDEPSSTALRAAWLADAAVITPHPYAHALYADKRNLVALSDPALLARWAVPEDTRALLAAGIPQTRRVDAQQADALWEQRRTLFFKPAAGYGSKAAYRGDKLTRRVFDEILTGGTEYVVQQLAPPSSRHLSVDGVATQLKLDLRNYVYVGRVQLVAARLWQGQTTNFRTPGGGFAPVLTVPDPAH